MKNAARTRERHWLPRAQWHPSAASSRRPAGARNRPGFLLMVFFFSSALCIGSALAYGTAQGSYDLFAERGGWADGKLFFYDVGGEFQEIVLGLDAAPWWTVMEEDHFRLNSSGNELLSTPAGVIQAKTVRFAVLVPRDAEPGPHEITVSAESQGSGGALAVRERRAFRFTIHVAGEAPVGAEGRQPFLPRPASLDLEVGPAQEPLVDFGKPQAMQWLFVIAVAVAVLLGAYAVYRM